MPDSIDSRPVPIHVLRIAPLPQHPCGWRCDGRVSGCVGRVRAVFVLWKLARARSRRLVSPTSLVVATAFGVDVGVALLQVFCSLEEGF